MKLIQANCRAQFTAEDFRYIGEVLAPEDKQQQFLVQLLTDAPSRDLILDDERLLRAILEQGGSLRVSSHLYFYILVRAVLKRVSIEDRDVADYLAEMLAQFARTENLACYRPGWKQPLDYIYEMIAHLQKADDWEAFLIRTHIGNHSLFMTGLFGDRIRYRAEYKGFPNLRYYEQLGKNNYRVASDHKFARRYELAPILESLSVNFEPARIALNDLSERLFSLNDPEITLPSAN